MPLHDDLTLTLESADFTCDRLRVRRFSGTEAIGRLFDYVIDVFSLDREGLDVSAIMGARVTLVIERSPDAGAGWHGTRRLHGVVAEVLDLLAGHGERRLYRLRVVPAAFALTLVQTQDIFIDLSVPEIVRGKLGLVSLADRLSVQLAGEYPRREFVVQYDETDLAFVSRLVEHLGISFFFVHEESIERMVFTDHPAGFPPIEGGPSVAYRAGGPPRDVFSLEAKHVMIPAYYAVRDYNYRTPLVDLTGEHEIASGFAGGVIEYGAHHKTGDEGRLLARIRAEERQATQLVYTGRSALPTLAAGARFTLEDHPDLGSLDLLVVAVEHRASQTIAGPSADPDEPGYGNTFRAVPASAMYRPPRVTPRPRIDGLLTGIIDVGPGEGPSRYARLDEEGRYSVRFLFDTTPEGRRAPSRPVRMAQNHAGEGYGTHFPLKPGVEVVVGFVAGDPDRPIIVGAVPNALHRSPVTNRNAGIHQIKTSTGISIDMGE